MNIKHSNFPDKIEGKSSPSNPPNPTTTQMTQTREELK